MYLLVLPVLLVLELAVVIERWTHEAVGALRGREIPPWRPTGPARRPSGPAQPIRLASRAAPPHATSPRPRPSRRFGWGLAVVILAGCLLFIDPPEVAAVLRRLSPQELVVLLLLAALDRVLVGLRWGVLLRLAGVRLPLTRAVRLFYQASFVGVFMPTHLGSDLLRAWWAVREGGAGHPVAASLVMERLLGFLSAANWAVAGTVVLAASRAPEHAWALAVSGVLAALAGNALFALSLSRRMHALVRRALDRLGPSQLARLLQHFYAAYALYGRDPRGLLLGAALALAEHGVQMLLVLAIALSIDVAASPAVLLAAATLFLLLVRLPLAPDGWGVAELSAVGLLGMAGVGAASAFSVSLVNHVVLMLALAPGLLLLLADRWRLPGPLGPLSAA